jgi:hypothetical protein
MLYFYGNNLIMKKLKPVYLVHLLLVVFAFSIQSCASKKSQIVVNEKVISKKYDNEISNKNILYLIDGKEVSSNDIKKLETRNIASMDVIKDQKEIAKYTAKKYDGLIIVKMKK